MLDVWARYLVIAAFVLAAVPARAAEVVRLQYRRAEGAARCPDEAALRLAVAARLGYHPWQEEAPRTIIVLLAEQEGQLRARIELRDAGGEVLGKRELAGQGDDCRELAAAVELAISIAIDPLSVTRAPGAPVPSAPATQPVAAPVARPAAATTSAPAPSAGSTATRSAPLHLAASLGGLIAVGSAPAVAGGLTLQARLRWRRFSVAVEGRLDLPAFAAVQGGEISSALLAGLAVPCAHYGRWIGCALLAVGALRAAGHELVRAEQATLPYIAGGARLGLEQPVFSRLALRLHADLLAPFSRISLRETSTNREFWTTPALSGAFGLGVVGSFL